MHKDELLKRYQETRQLTMQLCDPLPLEAFRIQPIPDVSPPWWNLGHTSWFFARNILYNHKQYDALDKKYDYLLNSYYETFGSRIARGDRGKITSPSTEKIFEYRVSVDERLKKLIQKSDQKTFEQLEPLVFIGIQHEQQHQELLITEIKNILSFDPVDLRISYCEKKPSTAASAIEFIPISGGLFEFGNVEGGWCWDNELGVHKYYLEDFQIANRLVTNGEFLEFVLDGGYSNSLLWLADGWYVARQNSWKTPLYWENIDGEFYEWSLCGLHQLDLDAPVCHISFYEASAFAEWKSQREKTNFRLPTEREWEHAARSSNIPKKTEDFLEGFRFHPNNASGPETLQQMYGVAWEWTSNHYEPYPKFRTLQGALAEYNGKFMNNQRVLRGGSCATPQNHIRISYRNFWEPSTRFQFTGIRLVSDE